MKLLKSNNALVPRMALGVMLLLIASIFIPIEENTGALPIAIHYSLVALGCISSGLNIVTRAIGKITKYELFSDEVFLALSALAAWIFAEARVSVFFAIAIWQSGELASRTAERIFNGSFAHLSSLVPDTVAVTFGGTSKQVAADEVSVGDIVQVKPGERVPIDGIIVEGESAMSTFAITGSGTSIPVRPGDRVLAGYANLASTVVIETRETISRSTVSKLLSWVSDSAGGSAGETLTRQLAFFLPIVFIVLAILAYTLPLIMQWDDRSMQRSVPSLLAMAFPSALTRTIPRFYRAGVALATKFGALFRDTASIDALSHMQTIYIEKEGTLTTGEYRVVSVDSEALPDEALILMAATAFGGCRYNSHYTQALLTAYGGRVDERVISRYSEGLDGVIVEIKDNLVAVGGRMLMDELKVETGDDSLDPDILYIAVNSRYAGRILLASTLREGASDVVYQFQSSDIRTIMFTDEDEITGKAAARSLGFDKCYPSRSYESKLHLVSEPRTGYAGSDKRLLDASGAGIKMTEPGPELLNASADSMPELTVFNSNPARIADAHKLSRQIRDASNLNFAVQLGFKTAGVILSFIGLLPFWAAIAIESGVKYICSARKI